MARALAIETSGRIGSVALAQGAAVLSEETFAHGLRHAAGLLPIIDRLCRDAGWGPGDLEHVYVSAGPGSFTGLRIGITVAKTLAFAVGARIVAVPSLRVLAENLEPAEGELIVVLDAKRGQVFAARFLGDRSAWREVEGARVDTLAAMLGRSGRPVWLLGEGIGYHRAEVPEDPMVKVTGEELWRGRASAVARLGAQMAERGEFAEAEKLTPIYIRRAEAEEKWENRAGDGPAL